MLRQLYDRSPIVVQNLMTSVYGWQLHRLRYGGSFRHHLEAIERTQWLSHDEIRGHRFELLRALCIHAYDNVPFYRQRFDRSGLNPSSLRSEDDLRRLPLLRRKEIQDHAESMVAHNFPPRSLREHFTSGTTSTPLRFFEDRDAVRRSFAFWMRFRKWFGFEPWKRRATFGGRIIAPRQQAAPPFWRRNSRENQMVFSSFHLSNETMPVYINRLERFAPFVVEGYVSSIFELARYINRNGITTIRPAAVQTTSETLLDAQRREIESAFQCKAFIQYGHGEKAAFISECERGRLHVSDEHGLIEIVTEGHAAKPGEIGNIVVTGFNNRAMPLIRYDTGDLAVPSAEQNCPCGRGLTLVESIEGRVLDVLRMPDGSIVPPTGLTLLFDKAEVMNIHEAQIVQSEIDLVTVRLVPRLSDQKLDLVALEADLRSMMGGEVEIRFEIVDTIPRTAAGKFRFVVSELDS